MYSKILHERRKGCKTPEAPQSGLMEGRNLRSMKTEDPMALLDSVYNLVRQRNIDVTAMARQAQEEANAALKRGMEKFGSSFTKGKATPDADVPEDTTPDTTDEEFVMDYGKGDGSYLDKMYGQESGHNPNAKNPESSATGKAQFIESTFINTVKSLMDKGEAQWAVGLSREELLAKRRQPEYESEVLAEFRSQNQAHLARNEIPVTDST